VGDGIEISSEAGLSGRRVLVARARLADGSLLIFSKYDSEDKWFLDASFGPKGYPHFCDGLGSRCCLKTVATEKMAVMIENAVAGIPEQRSGG
jgi:hypothetical protein